MKHTKQFNEYKDTYNSGIYFRVDTNNVLLEDLPQDQLQQTISTYSQEGLQRTIQCLSNSNYYKDLLINYLLQTHQITTIPTLYEIENYFNSTDKEDTTDEHKSNS